MLTEEYPVYLPMMRAYANDKSAWGQRARAWIEENAELRDLILDQLRRNGPTPSNKLEDKSQSDWESSGWTSGRNVSRMLHYLWMQGHIMVAGRSGIQKLWDLSERVLPGVDAKGGTGRPGADAFCTPEVAAVPGGSPLTANREQLYPRTIPPCQRSAGGACEGRQDCKVEVGEGAETLPGPWYVHADDLPLLESLQTGAWSPRTTLLSPFDNLICDRKRAEALFGFNFRIEIYVPKEQRKYGYYVLPILHGDKLIGRIDPAMDRKRKVLP